MAHLAPHFFATLNARLAVLQSEGRDIIRLDEGSPDLPPRQHIIDTLVRVCHPSGYTRYQPHRGPQRAARRPGLAGTRRQFGVELDPETEITAVAGLEGGHFSPEPGLARSRRSGPGT